MSKILKIIYDSECPFCRDFVLLQNLKKKGFDVELISARDRNNPLIIDLQKKFNLDNGMIVIKDDQIIYGNEAASFIYSSYDGKNLRGKMYSLILKNKFFSKFSYPILTFMRKLFFKLTGKKFINEN